MSNGNLDEIKEFAGKLTGIKVWEKESGIDSLTNVKSLTYRMFTTKENAASHCNTGNPKLVLDTIISWIKIIKKRTM